MPLVDRICNCLGDGAETDILKDHWRRLLNDGGRQNDRMFTLAVREYITGNDCLLLRSAVAARETGRKGLGQLTTELSEFANDRRLSPPLAAQLKIRSLLFRALAAESDDSVSQQAPPANEITRQISNAIREHIACVDAYWNWRTQTYTTERLKVCSGPAWLLGLGDQYRSILMELADKHGWMHPGLLMAAEIMARLDGQRVQPDATVRTWVMFAEESNVSVLARLTMERLPYGSGLLIPSAASSGNLLMGSQFSTGLQNAWHAVRQMYPGLPSFDWRWSLDLYHRTRRLKYAPMQVPIDGPSSEAAFACAMRALHPQHKGSYDGLDPLDPHVAVTECLQNPFVSKIDLLAASESSCTQLQSELWARNIYPL